MTVIDFETDTVSYPGFKNHWGLERSVFSRQTEDHDQDSEADDLDASAWGSGFEDLLPGQQKASAKIEGIHSNIRGQIGDVMRPLVGRAKRVHAWAARESLNALAPVEFQPCSVKKYSVTSKRKEVVKFTTELNARGAFNHNGIILVSPKSNTQMTTATGNGSVDIAPAATTYGGVAQMHLYDLAGGTTPGITVLIQHSTDGSVWSTLASFTVATNLTADTTFVQRVRVPTTTVVNAQTRASWTTTGTPTSVQGIVMFARGVDPDA